ncbi:MAG TPA: alpha/beta family hydrolase [Candidatus Limnocylindrales bacterium]|nr:alpha/beta family hydrolase [Candidatus Limnocylindrales bacterium]
MTVRFYVAHGASGSSASMRPHVEGLKRRGIDARAIDLPVRTAEDVVPRFREIVPDRPSRGGPLITVGGQSYGGRVATLAAAADGTEYAGIVCFSYPLHPPGRPEQAQARTAHWPSIRCPVLLLSGEADPFARIELLRAAVPLLRDAELHTYPKLGHSLKSVLDDALDRAAAFLGDLG